MGVDDIAERYLQLARAAEELIATLKDDDLKMQWREIASGYRNLAQARLRFAEGDPGADIIQFRQPTESKPLHH
jgi:hypothetical protein